MEKKKTGTLRRMLNLVFGEEKSPELTPGTIPKLAIFQNQTPVRIKTDPHGFILDAEEFKKSILQELGSTGIAGIVIVPIQREKRVYSLMVTREGKEFFILDFPLSHDIRKFQVIGVRRVHLSYLKRPHDVKMACIGMKSLLLDYGDDIYHPQEHIALP